MNQILAAIVLSLLLIPTWAGAETRWKDEIQRDLVQVAGDKFVSDDYSVCQFSGFMDESRSVQIRTRAEAPRKAMSRDFFVAWMTMGKVAFMARQTKEHGTLQCRSVGAPIGDVDVEFALVMTGEGYQLEIADRRTGQTNRTTRTWVEQFSD